MEVNSNGKKVFPVYAEKPLPPNPSGDTHTLAVQRFFDKYSCPLGRSTTIFINQAKLYNLDFRLLPAISFRESTCDKHKTDSNALGFGNYQFNNQELIPYVAQAVSGEGTKDAKYYKKAMKDSEKILRIYNTRPSYTTEVLSIMEEISPKESRRQ